MCQILAVIISNTFIKIFGCVYYHLQHFFENYLVVYIIISNTFMKTIWLCILSSPTPLWKLFGCVYFHLQHLHLNYLVAYILSPTHFFENFLSSHSWNESDVLWLHVYIITTISRFMVLLSIMYSRSLQSKEHYYAKYAELPAMVVCIIFHKCYWCLSSNKLGNECSCHSIMCSITEILHQLLVCCLLPVVLEEDSREHCHLDHVTMPRNWQVLQLRVPMVKKSLQQIGEVNITFHAYFDRFLSRYLLENLIIHVCHMDFMMLCPDVT